VREPPVSACPVPWEQQPINEYKNLSDSCFFDWATLELPGYLRKIAVIWGISWLITGPVAAASFAPAKYPVQFLLCGAGGASLCLSLLLLRLYLGWKYVGDRLSNETVFYEESGWYDGQTWAKTPEMLAQDRLIFTYQVQPILRRVVRTLGFLALLLLVEMITWIAWSLLGSFYS